MNRFCGNKSERITLSACCLFLHWIIHALKKIFPLQLILYCLLSRPFNRVLESHFQAQKENYEREIEGLNSKVEHLSHEINHLQNLFRKENDKNDSIRLQLARLTSENVVRIKFKNLDISSRSTC